MAITTAEDMELNVIQLGKVIRVVQIRCDYYTDFHGSMKGRR